VRVYLDVSCLNRPFDDQRQTRIRLESEAVTLIFERFDAGRWRHVSSEMARIEISAMADEERRRRVRALLPGPRDIIKTTPGIVRRATELMDLGLRAADAVHLAAAERAKADVLLTCDDRFCRAARRNRAKLKVVVGNPLTWLAEQLDDADA